jgi:hypothetical protein
MEHAIQPEIVDEGFSTGDLGEQIDARHRPPDDTGKRGQYRIRMNTA